MYRAGIRKAYIVLREGKWDIPTYYNDEAALLDMHLAYLMMRWPYGPPFTVDQAYAFVRHAIVAFGFPDILFEPRDAFVHLLERQAATGAMSSLACAPLSRSTRRMIAWTLTPMAVSPHRRQVTDE